MAGMIQTAKPDALSPQAVLAKMHVNPQQKQQLERIIAAGMKVLFDPTTHKLMLDKMNEPGPIEQKIGEGILNLLSTLWQESKQSLPPQLLIPAGLVLVAHVCDFMNKSGSPVTPKQQGDASEIMVNSMLKWGGIDPDKVAAKASGPQAPPQGVPA